MQDQLNDEEMIRVSFDGFDRGAQRFRGKVPSELGVAYVTIPLREVFALLRNNVDLVRNVRKEHYDNRLLIDGNPVIVLRARTRKTLDVLDGYIRAYLLS
jgi:hypothetical protein